MGGDGLFRLLIVAVLGSTVAVSGFFRQRARKGGDVIPRSAEPAGLRMLRAAMTLPYLVALLVFLIAPRFMTWSALPMPQGLRWIGFALGVMAFLLTFWTMRHLGTNVSETVLTKRHHELVASGPYRWVRHPLYTAGLVLLTAIGLMAANAFLLAWVLVAAIAFLAVIIPREEAELIRAFGDRYIAYRRHTGALLPRVGTNAKTIDPF